jgi:ferric-dicitrate binding protein FerR (iron transport regulator)
MKSLTRLSRLLAISVCAALMLPAAVRAQAQSAGQISRMIPDVNLQHGTRVQLAASGSKVQWGDLVTTDSEGRARIALDDGSILNVGSNSQIRVVQHDAANQRTQVQLAYGKLRASAIRLARPGSSFEVRTPTAVAGVVGTDFALEFTNDMTSIHVYEGSVNFCNLAGQCATIAAGFTAIVRGSQSPSPATPTPPSTAVQSVQSTSVGGGTGGGAGGAAGAGGAGGGGTGAATGAGVAAAVSHSAVVITTAIVSVVVPAAVVPVATHTTSCTNPAGRPGGIARAVVLPCGVHP